MRQLQLDVVVTRGDMVESTHHVHGVVVDQRGKPLGTARDPSFVTWWRSCAKPFQVMPLIEAGALDALGWENPELAVACGSHGGEPEHIAIVGSMLSDCGLPSRLHNNCSGKHAAMLARAVTAGWRSAGYEKQDHEVQKSVLEMVARWSGVPAASIQLAIDGCGVPVFGMPLDAMALAYARLGAAAHRGEEIPARVIAAMTQSAFMVGGTERFDTALIEDTGGRVIAKVGAEGVHSLCVPSLGIGAAIKVGDGAVRAQHVAVLHLLRSLGVLDGELTPRLQEYLRRPIGNTRGDVVGEIAPCEDFATKG